ncbi:MAG: PAS domain S-box protein [Acidimicrobiia bacterium]
MTEPPGVTGESERLFRAAFNHAAIGMALTAASGHLITTNPAFCDMLGYERGSLSGRHFAEITHPDDRAGSEDKLRSLVSGHAEALRWEKRYLHKAGRTVWARLSVAPVKDAQGEILYLVSQMEDITARKAAEAAARTNEERFLLTFESAASGMALVDPTNGQFLKVNQTGCEMLGYGPEEIKSLTIQDVTAPGDRADSYQRFRRVISGEIPVSRSPLNYLRSDGSTAHAIVSTALVRDSDGGPLHLVANVVDISEQVEAQARLKHLVESKDELIASVSHELRTPLTAVLGFAELLRGEFATLSPAEQVEIIESISNQTSDLTNIVEDLLVAARADNETLTVASVSVDLHAQSAQVLESMARYPAGQVISFTGPAVRGAGDPARVRQILRNLITNAFRYGGKHIELVTYPDGEWACVAVRDDGEGIAESERDDVFEPFRRSLNREALTASIGLGLSVSRKLARLMGGDLTYSYEDDKSVFELCLPTETSDTVTGG